MSKSVLKVYEHIMLITTYLSEVRSKLYQNKDMSIFSHYVLKKIIIQKMEKIT